MRYLMGMVMVFTLLGCPPSPVPPTPDDGDSGIVETDAASRATCSGWCAHAADLKCAAAKDTSSKMDGGTKGTCVDVCEGIQKSAIVTWNLSCRVKAKSCAAADNCENR